MNVGLKRPIAWKNSRHAPPWRLYLQCGIEEMGSPGIICIVCHQVLPHLVERGTSSTVIRGAPRHVAGAPWFVASTPGAPRLVVGASSCSDGRQECPPRVWYAPEIDASKITLHIISATPGGFQWLKYMLLMQCYATHCLGDGKCVILCRRVRGSVRAIRAVQNTHVFLTETWVFADDLPTTYITFQYPLAE